LDPSNAGGTFTTGWYSTVITTSLDGDPAPAAFIALTRA
jgi:hypothetical protein